MEAEKQTLRAWDGRSYTGRYVQVMNFSIARVISQSRKLVTLEDLFVAISLAHPSAFSEVLGVPCVMPDFGYVVDDLLDPKFEKEEFTHRVFNDVLALPEIKEAGVRFSAEVDRYLSFFGGLMSQMLEPFALEEYEVDSLHLAAVMLWDTTLDVTNMLNLNGVDLNQEAIRQTIRGGLLRRFEQDSRQREGRRVGERLAQLMAIKQYLLAHCFGQDAVIDDVIMQLSIFWTLPKTEQSFRPLSLFLTGATGSGKTHFVKVLQEAFVEFLGIPKIPTIDYSRFSTNNVSIDLIGRDTGWKDGGKEGILTGAAQHNPHGIIVVDNFDKGDPAALAYLNVVIEKGVLRDEYTLTNVYFRDNIVIVSANVPNFSESDDFARISKLCESSMPRDKIFEGVVKYYPVFGATMRIVDSIVLFKPHTATSIMQIVQAQMEHIACRLRDAYGLFCVNWGDEFIRVFVDGLASVNSAHSIESRLEEILLRPVQQLAMVDFEAFSKCKRVELAIETPPQIDGETLWDGPNAFAEWLVAHTQKRLLQAKRLQFSVSVTVDGRAVKIRINELKYVVLPSIEDTQYFSVVVPDTSFDDLVGASLVRERVAEVIEYFSNPHGRTIRPDTGMILYGPPGTGKTSVAKAIAKELGVPFIMVMGSDFSKGVVGAGVDAVKQLFAAARKYRAVVFIDEIDGIGSRDKEGAEGARVINALLTELDGFTERNMLVIGATNRYEVLDEALLRPGRLSLKVQLGLLHLQEDRRRLINLCVHKAKMKIDDEIIEHLVQTSAAWSPANIVAMVNGGLRIAQREHVAPELRHFLKSRTIVLLGEDNQSVESSEETMWQIAVHEAGHALAALLLGIPFVQVTINGVGARAGFVERIAEAGIATAKKLKHYIDMSLAGRAAERILAEATDGVGSDFARATHLAIRMVRLGLGSGNILTLSDENPHEFLRIHRTEVEGLLRERMTETENLLNRNREALKAIAEALVVQKLLFEADIRAIVEQWEANHV